MPTYLLELSFGPVQGFIAAARRSRDLWAGSHILSELARAAGKYVLDQKGTLIYPVDTRVNQENKEENSNLSNVLLARVEAVDADAVKILADGAQAAARRQLKRFANEAWYEWGSRVKLRQAVWDGQVADALESYAAWAEFTSEDGYRASYEQLKKAFAARKNTRNFLPFAWADLDDLGHLHQRQNAQFDGTGIPKSSLDGVRESVLPDKPRRVPAAMGLSAGEQLDALGVIKRYIGFKRGERFTALTRVAAHSWLNILHKEAPDQLKQLCAAYEPLVDCNYATRAAKNIAAYQDFPYDGGLLYPERLSAAIAEVRKITKNSVDPEEQLEAKETALCLMHLEDLLRPLWRRFGTPCPYAALLQGDGDRMGRFLDKANTQDKHHLASKCVANFADHVPRIAIKNAGAAVYAGGEDLMLVLPLAQVVPASRALSEQFAESMKEAMEKLGVKEKTEDAPTLRIGAAICHVLEPLGTIRDWAAAAEKFAKGAAGTSNQGNALGLRLHVRAGHDIPVRLGFDDKDGFGDFQDWIKCYENRTFPARLGYDLRDIGEAVQQERMAECVGQAEWARLLERAELAGVNKEEAKAWRERLAKKAGSTADDFLNLAHQLITARWLAARTASDVAT